MAQLGEHASVPPLHLSPTWVWGVRRTLSLTQGQEWEAWHGLGMWISVTLPAPVQHSWV